MRTHLLAMIAGAASLSFAQAPASPTDLSSILGQIPARSLGPTTMGGRISDLAVYEKEPRIFYTATASGGLWKTVNGGITCQPVFYKESVVALGAVTVSQSNPDVVWVGTGEQNNRNSTSWGAGVFRSLDGGKTWANMGLADTRHVSRIVIDPKNENTVYVAALGHLWGPNKERGIYKTTDGGKTWANILKGVNDLTGFTDLVMDPKNPSNLLAASYERRRWAYKWSSGGAGSALYKSTNGGRNWKIITKGLPAGPLGRIGLSYFRKDPKIVVAAIEHRTEGGVYRSTDGGDSWAKINKLNPRPFYFSQIRQDPNDENRIYLPATNFHYSEDKGATFKVLNASVHVDYHALWIDPNDSNHMLVGNDGGVGQSRDRGAQWEHVNNMDLGQFYAVAFDYRKPYYVYGGLQDNGSWGGPSQQRINGAVKAQDWYQVSGGDGFHVQVDPENWKIVYSESQGGAAQRLNQVTGERKSIRPRPATGETLRFNWSTPLIISPHNSATLYMGANKLFKSVNRGDSWKAISPDLTTNNPIRIISPNNPSGGVTVEDTGAERHCTIITISESPRQQGVVYVGTDDGLLWVTKDDGDTWSNITANLPGVPSNTWVSRVTASAHADGRAYATFDGHRDDNYKPYVYVTEDFGQTWKPLTTGLGDNDSAYVIKEGLRNPDLLFLGTEIGLYVSLNRGASWTKYLSSTFGTVRVDDVAIHPRESDLIVATHGRSFWIVPINALENLTSGTTEKDVVLFKPTPAYYLGYTQDEWYAGDREFASNNTTQTRIEYWLKAATTEKVTIIVQSAGGDRIGAVEGTGNAGLNAVNWRPRPRLLTSDYTLILKIGEKEYRSSIRYEDLSQGERAGAAD